jgi:hypothetical protein
MTTPPPDQFDPQDADHDPAAWADAPLPECWSFASAWYSAHAAIRNAGVIGLDDAVAQCAMAVARQQAAGSVPRLLFVGATGKSMLMHATAEAICHATGRTFITLSGATLSPSGWEGLTLRQALRNTPNAVVCLDAIDSMVVAVDEHTRGNTAAHRESLAADLISLMAGAFTLGRPPATLATASLKRLRLPDDGSLTPEALREAGMDASLASLWQPIYLPALDPSAVRHILHTRAIAEATTISHATGYEVVWTALALHRVEQAAIKDPQGGVRLGLNLIMRAIDAALLNAVATQRGEGTVVTVSPEHVPPTTPPRGPSWVDLERRSYG